MPTNTRMQITAALADAGRTRDWLANTLRYSTKYVTDVLAGVAQLTPDLAEKMLAAIGPSRIVTGPAVTFNVTAVRTWLDREGDDGTGHTFAAQLGVDYINPDRPAALLTVTGHILDGLDKEYKNPHVWALADGINAIGMCPASFGDSPGALVYVDLGDGVRLASLHQRYIDMAGNHVGADALVAALTTVAEQANKEVTTYRQVNRLDHEITYQWVQIDMSALDNEAVVRHTLALVRELGIKRRVLDRSALFIGRRFVGLGLGREFNLAAAMRYCDLSGLPYKETRESSSPERQEKG